MAKKALIIALLALFLKSVFDILVGNLPFWYDPARDLLAAQANLQKISLIGPTTGIPGIFYGPYWIWLLSLGLIVSRDPRIIAILTTLLPYFIFLPWLLSKMFGKTFGLVIALAYLLIYGSYASQLWNPHLAPLLFVGLVYCLVFSKKLFWLAGFLCGLIFNIHMSFGIAVTAAASIYVLVSRRGFSFFVGLALSFIPFMIFEVRHGFNQTRVFFDTFIGSLIFHRSPVGVTGMSKIEILQQFLNIPNRFLTLPLIAVLTGELLILWRQKTIKLAIIEKQFLGFLLFSLSFIAFIYFSSKNPVWSYHFIAVDILVLLILSFLIEKTKISKALFTALIILSFTGNIFNFLRKPIPDVFGSAAIKSKEDVVNLIYSDADNKPFSVFAYSSAIYTFDYDYLFGWLGHYRPTPGSELVYLIIPEATVAVKEDFIHYRTPVKSYTTVNEWTMPDGTWVIKRVTL